MRIKKESFYSLKKMLNHLLEDNLEVARREELIIDIKNILDDIYIAELRGSDYIVLSKNELRTVKYVLDFEKEYNIFSAIYEIDNILFNKEEE